MVNVDVCVCCGKVIPEGAMVCCECQLKHYTYKETGNINLPKETEKGERYER